MTVKNMMGYVPESPRLYVFFSSRRRHTRSLCDWSSDVCSSDLKQKTAYKSTRLNSIHTVISYAVFCLRSEEHTSELQSHGDLECCRRLEKNKVRECTSVSLLC